jgi:hypothetical protein
MGDREQPRIRFRLCGFGFQRMQNNVTARFSAEIHSSGLKASVDIEMDMLQKQHAGALNIPNPGSASWRFRPASSLLHDGPSLGPLSILCCLEEL